MLRRSKNKSKASAEASEPTAAGVLVACDDADARELISRVVGRGGHEVEQADGTAAALEALAAHRRLALVTLLRSDKATGLVDDVRNSEDPELATIPVIVVTDDEAMATAASIAGADGTIVRPFHADELTEELDSILARSPEERSEMRAGAALRRQD